MTWLWVAIAGGFGAICRYLVDGFVLRYNRTQVPAGTLLVNALGSLALGLIAGWIATRGTGHVVQLIAGTGFLGGFTTFSAASVETVRLVLARSPRLAAAYAIGTVLLCVALAAAGLALGRLAG